MGLLPLAEFRHLGVAEPPRAKLFKNVPIRPTERGEELRLVERHAQFREQPQPTLKVRLIRIDEHPVDVEDHGQLFHGGQSTNTTINLHGGEYSTRVSPRPDPRLGETRVQYTMCEKSPYSRGLRRPLLRG